MATISSAKTEETILRISTDLQWNLIKSLANADSINKQLLNNQLKVIVDKCDEVLRAESCSIIMIDSEDSDVYDERKDATLVAATGHNQTLVGKIKYMVLPGKKVKPNPEKQERLGITGWVISTGKSFLSSSQEDSFNHPHYLGQGVPPGQTQTAFLAVPMRNPRGKIIGALRGERTDKISKEPFSVREQMILETIAQVSGRCIAHYEDSEEGDANTAIIAWVLDVISEAVASEGELDSFLDIVVRLVSAATLADSCSVFLIDEHNKTLTQRAGCGSQELRELIRSYLLPDVSETDDLEDITKAIPKEKKIGLTSWIASTGRSHYAQNFEELRNHPHHKGEFDKKNFKEDQQCGAFYGVPLKVGGTVTGVLKIENVSPLKGGDSRGFSEDIRERLDTLATSVALAIKRLQDQSSTRYGIIQHARPKIFEILKGDLGIKELVEKIVKETKDLYNARACALFLKEGEELIQPKWAAVGWAGKGASIRKYNLVKEKEIAEKPPSIEEKVGLTVWIAEKKIGFTAKSNIELLAHPHHKGTYDNENFDVNERCESFMGAPLLIGDKNELLGVLKVETKMKNVDGGQEFAYFNEQDELVFEFITNSAAIAIQNARLRESNSLAEKIMSSDRKYLIPELIKFIEKRVEVVNVLENTCEIVINKDRQKEKGEIIKGVVYLLNPAFNIIGLKEFIDIVDQPYKGLLDFVYLAANVENLDDISKLNPNHFSSFETLKDDFAMHTLAEVITETHKAIAGKLNLFNASGAKRKYLQECLGILNQEIRKNEETNLLERNLLQRIFNVWNSIISSELEKFIKIKNSYMAGLPLPPGSPLFFGRQDIFSWITEKLRGGDKQFFILYGSAHTGKTSILKQLQFGSPHLPNSGRIFPVFIDLQSFKDPGTDNFLFRLAQTIHLELQQAGLLLPEMPSKQYFSEGAFGGFSEFLKKLVDTIRQKEDCSLLLMLDEFESLGDLVKTGKLDSDIFVYLRSIMQHQEFVSFIVAGRKHFNDLPPENRIPILDIGENNIREVGFLDQVEAEKLITHPVLDFGVNFDDEVKESIFKVTNGHPYFIQQICSNCMEILNKTQKDYNVTPNVLEAAMDLLFNHGETTTVVLDELWDTAEEAGQKILKRLAFMISADNSWVHEKQLFDAIVTEEGIQETAASAVLFQLGIRQLVMQDKSQKKYGFSTELLRQYILEKKL